MIIYFYFKNFVFAFLHIVLLKTFRTIFGLFTFYSHHSGTKQNQNYACAVSELLKFETDVEFYQMPFEQL